MMKTQSQILIMMVMILAYLPKTVKTSKDSPREKRDIPPPRSNECRGCGQFDTVCDCTLEINYGLSSMLERQMVRPFNGRLKYWNSSVLLTEEEEAQVISTDGWNPELVITINGQFPGPNIIAYEGQDMVMRVVNKMHTDSTTIHWHGLHQRGTPWMDGVGMVTQCAIGPEQTFVYRFKANPHGTNLYHAHLGDQRSMGLYGALIIRQPNIVPRWDEEFVVTLQDWNHDMDPETAYYTMVSEQYNFLTNRVINTTYSVDGAQFSRFVFQSGLINGKGRYYRSTVLHNGSPLEIYRVRNRRSYRFRVISAATLYPFRVRVEDHDLDLVASDGFEFDPISVQSFVIQPGERFDFILMARNTQRKKQYMLVAETLEADLQNAYHAAEAIISFEDFSGPLNLSPPKAPSEDCSFRVCRVFNCPFPMYPRNQWDKRTCIDFETAVNRDPLSNVGSISGTPDKEIFFNFAFPGRDGNTPGSVNGRQFEFTSSPVLTQYTDMTSGCENRNCSANDTCTCTYIEEITSNQLVQLVFLNMGVGRGWSHPVHIHGHAMHIMKIAYGNVDQTTFRIQSDNTDIVCPHPSNFCNDATWRSQSPTLRLQRPPQKDTIIVPTGGYVVVRFRADNPGVWFLHCHIDLHNTNGMGLLIRETSDSPPSPPSHFPVCGNFDPYFVPLNPASVITTSTQPTSTNSSTNSTTDSDADDMVNSPWNVAFNIIVYCNVAVVTIFIYFHLICYFCTIFCSDGDDDDKWSWLCCYRCGYNCCCCN